MKKLTGNELRKLWLDFFEKKGHFVVESASLVPINDPSLLWINAGVATLKPYFTGKEIPPKRRLTNSQRCIRTNDIENVGVTSRHLTFFEMLGNFSIGDYFKKEAIEFAYELIFQVLEMKKSEIYVTVFKDDPQAYKIWHDLGIADDHIVKGSHDRNFWDLGMGPCGPCTEIYFDRGEKYDPSHKGIELLDKDIENDRYIEIWNIVFSEFNNDGHNNYTNLVSRNIDTGAGFERLLSIIQDVPTNFDTDLFQPIIKVIEKYLPNTSKYVISDYFSTDPKKHKLQQYFRVVADHFRSSVFAIADGVLPANKDRGYILRKLIRRMMVYANKLGFNIADAINELVDTLINQYAYFYEYLPSKKTLIISVFDEEIKNFNRVLKDGLLLLNNQIDTNKSINGEFIFRLVETHGIPLEIIQDICHDNQIDITEALKVFNVLFTHHQQLSKSNNDDIKGMVQQNKNLLQLKVDSTFDRKNNHILSKCVALFDLDFNHIKVLNGSGYAVFAVTPFYATVGGQQHDVGEIQDNDLNVGEVVDVIKGPNLQHIHLISDAKNIEINHEYVLSYDESKRLAMRRNHTAEHLLQSTLKRLFSHSIKQEGAFKSHEKATFDFSFEKKLTENDLEKLENEILKIIQNNIQVTTIMATLEEAKKMNALAYFEDRYAKLTQGKLRVVKIGDISAELCGGTHTDSTGEVEDFFVKDYYSIGNNKWRIEVITGKKFIEQYFQNILSDLQKHIDSMMSVLVNANNSHFLPQINKLKEMSKSITIPKSIHQIREYKKNIDHLENEIKNLIQTIQKYDEQKQSTNLVKVIESNIQNNQFVVYSTIDCSNSVISMALKNLVSKYTNLVFTLINQNNEHKTIQYFISCNKLLAEKVNCARILETINSNVGGHGGGKSSFAQGGTNDLTKLELVKSTFVAELKKCAL